MAITKISPFYEPGAPSPPVPLLTSQAEFCYEPTNAVTITAQEEIPSGPTAATRQKVFQSLPRARFRSPVLHHRASPGPSRNHDNLSDLSDLSELEPSSDSETSVSSVNSREGMIPKPEGESGRLNRGGYNLQDALGWNSRQFKKVKIFVNQQVDQQLDPKRCYSEQSDVSLQFVRDASMKRFDDLENYVGCWPVDDLIKSRLKSTSAKWRREQRLREGDLVKDQAEYLKAKAKKKTKKRKV